ncbi:MAG: cytochrome ubiquinol oxidase subunit I [Desulfobacterales bacterium]|mgnify:CR=1 FL=1|jgi:cytochrome bd ubiquinol oxidase subunit I|nr:cytochrome ubiquinol oxidase subunit I [Desulfobacteraceae bacterium]MBT4365203.1 cytochrome ubiquinol oxidase subunit I [Desulfobacteraceae bacterium]MBT7085509.1 cytochrome ubiquinol oxidase subunit I [Desulfobacterales bacterium]MBT7695998.1 cytochrome ubiquinol oxidase subunit I [Desulfobacterales bacterium]
MSVEVLSRLQFAAATMFHFLFVPLTLGLSILIAYMETMYVKTEDETYLRMTKFWGKLFLINFALGIVTGITLEFQFGTNWSRYSAYVGDIFGSLLAIEASVAFFLESTLIGVWVFGWNKISKKAHAIVMWLIAFAGTFSGIWIIAANAWMQHPVGYTIRNGRAELTDFFAILTQKFAILEFFHTISAAYILSSFFIMGISAYHLLKKQNIEFFTRSFKIALVLGLVFSFFEAFEGHLHGADLAESQPAKLAALDAHWETSKKAPMYLFAIPDQENERNIIEIGPIPGMLSLLAHHDINAEVIGLKDIPKDERPPVLITYSAFKIMVGLGFYFCLMTLLGWFFKDRLTEKTWYLKMLMLSIPLPYIAIEMGWIVAEVGRQPWIVYGIMKTSDAVSPITSGQVLTTLISFVLVYGLLGAVGFYLIWTNARKGPDKV